MAKKTVIRFSAIAAVVALPWLSAWAQEPDFSAGDIAVLTLGVGPSVVCAVVNTARLIRGEPKPVMGYIGLGAGLIVLGAGAAYWADDGGPEAIVPGLLFTTLSVYTVYSAHKHGGPEVALTPSVSPEKQRFGVALQMRVRF